MPPETLPPTGSVEWCKLVNAEVQNIFQDLEEKYGPEFSRYTAFLFSSFAPAKTPQGRDCHMPSIFASGREQNIITAFARWMDELACFRVGKGLSKNVPEEFIRMLSLLQAVINMPYWLFDTSEVKDVEICLGPLVPPLPPTV